MTEVKHLVPTPFNAMETATPANIKNTKKKMLNVKVSQSHTTQVFSPSPSVGYASSVNGTKPATSGDSLRINGVQWW